MTSEANDQIPRFTYELVCTDCSFETTVEGRFLDALDVADDHQEEHGGEPIDHFVNVEQNGRRGSSEPQ